MKYNFVNYFGGSFLETSLPAASEIPTEPREEKKGCLPTLLGSLLDLAETIILSVALFLGINALTARVLVDGYSMQPTLQDGEYILVNKMAYRTKLPDYGDIVVFHFPIDPNQDFIKRVIGLPGDQVEVGQGEVSVNGQVLREPYIAASPQYAGVWQVPEGYIFVLGDNRNNSSDSHSWGAVPKENVVGKAVLVYWPPPEWQTIKDLNLLGTGP